MPLGVYIAVVVGAIAVSAVCIYLESRKKKMKDTQTAGKRRNRERTAPPVTEDSARLSAARRTEEDLILARKLARKADAARTADREPRIFEGAGHHSAHCETEHSGNDLYAVEKVPAWGSIKGGSVEGCAEHAGVRFVKIEKREEKSSGIEVSPEDIRKAVVLGQVINDPAFRRGRAAAGNMRRGK